eukprot:GILJ01003766.1.p1 GENE.GILJ01003766.1~~GILJ01003766.1.p1  ORF type:complete len:511 (+),score=89.55 GILJ01003766.1:40-1533(+)
MVLAELGGRISAALAKLHKATVIDDEVLDACLKEIAAALLSADVNVRFVSQLRNNIKTIVNMQDVSAGTNRRKLVQKCVLEELCRMLDPGKKPYVMKKGKPNVIMFVGLQGSGKTTSCTKFAYYYQRKGWKTCLICADTFRAGAFDQLKQNATKAKIPFYGSYTETDPVKIAEEGVAQFRAEHYEVIIVDTSGRHRQEQELFDEMKQVAEAVQPDDVIFTMDSSIGQACFDQAQAFRQAVNVGSVIVTKLDGHARGGGALSAVAATESPIIFIGTGEHFDDFEQFEVKSFVSRLLGFGDISGLFDTIREAVPEHKQPEMIKRISQGVFTLRDMKDQFQNVLKLGPLGKVMSMIPGMGSNLIPKGKEKEGIARIKRFMCMMDSMTDAELDGEKQMVPSRITRVARGSGTSIREVNELIEQHKQFAKMVGNMGKMNFGKKTDLTQMTRNPGQMMQQVSRMMDPKMLKSVGGAGNIMNMMKEMGKMDMGSMMEAFKGMKM